MRIKRPCSWALPPGRWPPTQRLDWWSSPPRINWKAPISFAARDHDTHLLVSLGIMLATSGRLQPLSPVWNKHDNNGLWLMFSLFTRRCRFKDYTQDCYHGALPKLIRDCTDLSQIKTHLFTTAVNVWLCALCSYYRRILRKVMFWSLCIYLFVCVCVCVLFA